MSPKPPEFDLKQMNREDTIYDKSCRYLYLEEYRKNPETGSQTEDNQTNTGRQTEETQCMSDKNCRYL